MNWIERALLLRSATRNQYTVDRDRHGCMGCGCLPLIVLTLLLILIAARY
jgi:hypothetical protein